MSRENKKEDFSYDLNDSDIDDVYYSDEYYGNAALDVIIGETIRSDNNDGQLNDLRYFNTMTLESLASAMEEFQGSNQDRAIIPLHVPVSGSGQANHFAGLYIERVDNNNYHVFYIDPLGSRANISATITDLFSGWSNTNFVSTVNIFQPFEENDEVLANVHCGAFTAYLLTRLANRRFIVEGNRLFQIEDDGSRTDLHDRAIEESNKFGDLLRKEHIEILAIRDYARAQTYMGLYLHDKKEDNSKEKVKWLEKAALAGDSYAQYNLGFSYAKGDGVEKDERTAIFWYEQALNLGNYDVINELNKLQNKEANKIARSSTNFSRINTSDSPRTKSHSGNRGRRYKRVLAKYPNLRQPNSNVIKKLNFENVGETRNSKTKDSDLGITSDEEFEDKLNSTKGFRMVIKDGKQDLEESSTYSHIISDKYLVIVISAMLRHIKYLSISKQSAEKRNLKSKKLNALYSFIDKVFNENESDQIEKVKNMVKNFLSINIKNKDIYKNLKDICKYISSEPSNNAVAGNASVNSGISQNMDAQLDSQGKLLPFSERMRDFFLDLCEAATLMEDDRRNHSLQEKALDAISPDIIYGRIRISSKTHKDEKYKKNFYYESPARLESDSKEEETSNLNSDFYEGSRIIPSPDAKHISFGNKKRRKKYWSETLGGEGFISIKKTPFTAAALRHLKEGYTYPRTKTPTFFRCRQTENIFHNEKYGILASDKESIDIDEKSDFLDDAYDSDFISRAKTPTFFKRRQTKNIFHDEKHDILTSDEESTDIDEKSDFLDDAYDSDFISDEQMAESVFGRQSNTAKEMKKK